MKFLRSLPVFLILIATVAMAQSNPVPLLYQTNPVSIKPGSKAFELTVSGTGFVSGAVVNWNGSPLTTTFVSSSQLKAAISAKDVAKASTASVTAVNSGSGAVSSNVLYFPIRTSSSTVTMKQGTQSIMQGAIAIGDFNKDGNLDVVVDHTKKGESGWRGTLYSYLGAGDGTFKVAQRTPGIVFAEVMTTGDFNGDGNLDLLLAMEDQVRAPMPMFPGKGDGTFGPSVRNDERGGYFITTADVNGDGKLDVVAEGVLYGDPWVGDFLGNGSGTFGGEIWSSYESGGQVAFGDFNGDGILDLAVAGSPPYYGVKDVLVFLGKGDGSFASPVGYDTPYPASGIAAVDLNGDGNLDLVTDGVSVLLGNGDGTFTQGSSVPVYGSYGAGQNVNVGDFNGDGKLDVAVVSVDESYNQTVAILLGNGDGTFQTPIEFAGGVNPLEHHYGFFMGDFNHDGKLDLILEQELSQHHTNLFLQQ
jgi:hypothetical protein